MPVPWEELHYQSGKEISFQLQLSLAALYLCITRRAPFDVITPWLIFRSTQPNLALQFVRVFGFCLGIAIFLRGLRSRRTRVQASVSSASISSRANGRSFPPRTEEVAAPLREIIRLSPEPVPMKSAEMTQQQKIAAALARAGTSHSTAWVHESTGVAVEVTDPDPLAEKATPMPDVHSAQLQPTRKSSDTSHLMIWGGL